MGRRQLIIGSVMAVVITIAVVAYLVVSSMATEWLRTAGLNMVQEKLQTRVVMKELRLRLFDGMVYLYGFEMDDRHDVRMLKVDTLLVNTDVYALLKKEIVLEEVTLKGAEVNAYKERKDSAANYQFVVDAFAKKDKKEHSEEGTKKKKKNDIYLQLKKLELKNVSLAWNLRSEQPKDSAALDPNHLQMSVRSLLMTGLIDGSRVMNLGLSNVNIVEEKSRMAFSVRNGQFRAIGMRHMATRLDNIRLAYKDKKVGVDHLSLWGNTSSVQPDVMVKIDSLRYFCNNGKPRKNVGRPNRGAFDKGHLDAVLNIEAVLHGIKKDSIAGTLKHLWAKDKGSGLLVTNVKTDFLVTGSTDTLKGKTTTIGFKNLELTMPKTKVVIPTASVNIIKGKVKGQKAKVVINPLHLSAHVGLQDIAEPFAPPLSHFTTPLNLEVDVKGDLDRILFNNIRITSKGQRLRLTAEGDLCDVTKKKALSLHFHNIHLSTHGGVKEEIIDHFRKKINLKMEKQMQAIGDVDFSGRLTIIYKKELIDGTLFTRFGNVDVNFEVNGFTRYLNGTMHGRGIEIGKVMNVEGLGPITASANYSFNIASKKKMRELGRNPGKLPIGTMQAKIEDVSFKKVAFHNITVHMKSNGTVAQGDVSTSMKLFDLQAQFMYKQTATEQSWKIKPRFVKHQKSAAEIAEKERKAWEKAQRKAEKEEKRKERKSLFSKIKEQINAIGK